MNHHKDQNYFAIIEKQDFYEIIENKYGEIAIFIDARDGQPEHPELLFDGKSTALLKRSSDLSIKLDGIHDEAREPLAAAEVVMIAELRGKIVERIYGVPVDNVEEIIAEGLETRGDEIRRARNVDDLLKKFGAVKRWSSGEKA